MAHLEARKALEELERETHEADFDRLANIVAAEQGMLGLEINLEKSDKVRGLNITICTTAKKDEEAKELLEDLENKSPLIKKWQIESPQNTEPNSKKSPRK